MAEIVKQNPYSSEIQSPLIAGLSEGLNKISAILNLETGEFVDMPIEVVPIDTTEENKHRIYEMPFGQKLWLRQPRPIVKRNGTEITPDKIPFTIDYIGGSITFEKPLNPLDPSTPPISENDSITVSATYIKGSSTTLNAISNLLTQVEQKADRYKGYFATIKDLQLAFSEGTSGDIAFVEKPQFALYSWDSTQSKWRNTQSIEDLSDYYTKSEIDGFLQETEEMKNNNHYKAFLLADENSILVDLDGTPILADWKYQIVGDDDEQTLKVNQLTSTTDMLQNQIVQLNAILESNKVIIKDLQNQINQLNTTLESDGVTIKDLQNRLSEVEAEPYLLYN